MKKIVKLSLILLIAVFMMGSVYAALSCEVSLGANKTQINKNEEFTVDINLSKIQSEKGIISLGATLEYDKESLELVEMEGKNGWETPTEGASFNQNNGKIAITRGGQGKNDETVFTATFKPKEASKKNLMITLKNITVADGTMPAKIKTAYQNITVKDGTTNPVPKPDPDDETTNTNTNTTTNITTNTNTNLTGNTNKNTTTNTVNKNAIDKNALPKAGDNIMTMLLVGIGFIVLLAVIFLVKIKIIDHKTK